MRLLVAVLMVESVTGVATVPACLDILEINAKNHATREFGVLDVKNNASVNTATVCVMLKLGFVNAMLDGVDTIVIFHVYPDFSVKNVTKPAHAALVNRVITYLESARAQQAELGMDVNQSVLKGDLEGTARTCVPVQMRICSVLQ